MQRINRKYTICLISLLLVCVIILTGCSGTPVTKSGLLLDTVVSITVYDGSQEDLDAAFDLISDYNDKLDAFSKTSEIGRINADSPTVLSDDIYGLLKDSVDYQQKTGGAFDPVLGSLIDLWHIQDPEVREAPSSDEVAGALSHSGSSLLILDDQTQSAQLTDPDASVNLGADAKGFVGDQVAELLQSRGVKHALINLGGNIVAVGGKSSFEKFTIGIDNPFDTSKNPTGTLSVSDQSVVTSGDYQRYFTDSSGKKYHHILDPTTGYPADSGLTQVVVVADSSETADILSTSLFVLGKDKGLAFLKQIDPDGKIGVIFTDKEKNITVTGNLKDNYTLADEYKNEFTVTYS